MISKSKYHIDQSIKIENTSKATYLAIANGKHVVFMLQAKEKRILEQVFRKLGKPVVFKLFTFSYLCAVVIEKVHPHRITIDQEYIGHEKDIKNYITQLLTISRTPIPEINFHLIGKGSSAHHHAYQAFKHKLDCHKVTYQEIVKKYGQIDR